MQTSWAIFSCILLANGENKCSHVKRNPQYSVQLRIEKSEHGENQTAWINQWKGPVTIFGQYQIHFENILISNYPSVKLLYNEYKTTEAIG